MHECKVPSGLPGSHRRLTGLQPCSSHHSRTSFVVAHHGNPPSHAPKDMAGRVALLPGATCLCSKAECVCVCESVCVCVCVCVQLWSVLSLLWLTCLCGVVCCGSHACVVLSMCRSAPSLLCPTCLCGCCLCPCILQTPCLPA